MKVRRWTFTQVVVPARPDSVNSPEHDHPLHQLAYGGRPAWSTQFDAMPKTIIELETDAGVVGLGETYRGLGREAIDPIAEGLLGVDLERLALQRLPIPEGRLYDGFELAIADAVAKGRGLPLCGLLGGAVRESVRCGYWTGHRSVADAARKAREGQEAGFDCIKFKCGLEDPVVEWCAAVRDACGPGFQVILDPNRRWGTVARTVRIARQLERVGNVHCLEDPIARHDLEGFALLRRKLDLPLAVHVSLPYLEMGQLESDALSAVRAGSCDLFNFNGGLFGVRRMATVAEAAGLSFWHGSEVDLGILEASYVHKAAASPNCTEPSDIFGRLVREHDLLVEPLKFDARGYVALPSGPGLGVALDREAVAHYQTKRWEVGG